MATKEQTHPDIPDDQFDNPFNKGTFLHEKFEKIYREDRDFLGIISDMKGRRGTGKTIASMQLANDMDQTDRGLSWSKCTLSGENFINSYSGEPLTSGLVLDEAEIAASNREAMTTLNRALRKMLSIGRVEQKYVWVNVPLKHFVDKDILKLADVWVGMQRRGKGLVHELNWEAYSETLQTPKKQTIEFDDIEKGTELREVYNKLTKEKRKHIQGEEADKYVPQDEHKEELKKAREEARKEARYETIKDIYTHPECEMAQRAVGEAVGLSQPQIGKIVRDKV